MNGISVEVIDKILTLGADAASKITVHNGRPYFHHGSTFRPIDEPRQSSIAVHGLAGLADFIRAEAMAVNEYIIHVQDARHVSIIGPVTEPWKGRTTFADAEAITTNFEFGRYYQHEDFIIKLMTQFQQDETTANLLAAIGNVADGQVIERSEDGTTQEVNVKRGVTRKETVAIPNPLTLAPYRTFSDVAEQPRGLYVFRMQSGTEGPRCALMEADGRRWELEAIGSIVDWFKTNMPEESLRIIS